MWVESTCGFSAQESGINVMDVQTTCQTRPQLPCDEFLGVNIYTCTLPNTASLTVMTVIWTNVLCPVSYYNTSEAFRFKTALDFVWSRTTCTGSYQSSAVIPPNTSGHVRFVRGMSQDDHSTQSYIQKLILIDIIFRQRYND